MTGSADSKDLWLSIVEEVPDQNILLGKQATNSYLRDPKHLAFVASRYKFVAKLVRNAGIVLEIGCGDGFGAPIVAAEVQQLLCADIDERSLEDNRRRMAAFSKISFLYHDFRSAGLPRRDIDAIYAIDVIEHIYKAEEDRFLKNIVSCLQPKGFAIIGTPNKASEQYASEYSKIGHVNVKSFVDLETAMRAYFDNVFMFGMNDEVVHTGYPQMCHYLWALCVGPKTESAAG